MDLATEKGATDALSRKRKFAVRRHAVSRERRRRTSLPHRTMDRWRAGARTGTCRASELSQGNFQRRHDRAAGEPNRPLPWRHHRLPQFGLISRFNCGDFSVVHRQHWRAAEESSLLELFSLTRATAPAGRERSAPVASGPRGSVNESASPSRLDASSQLLARASPERRGKIMRRPTGQSGMHASSREDVG